MSEFNDEVQRLLEEDRLIKWVLDPDEATAVYWEKWMQEHPNSITALFKAREIAQDLAYTQRPANPSSLADTIWSGITAEIDQPAAAVQPRTAAARQAAAFTPAQQITSVQAPDREPESSTVIIPIQKRSARSWWIAAALTGTVLFGSSLYYRHHHTTEMPGQQIANLLVKEDIDRVNLTDRSQVIYLVDGTKVTLQPGAGIRHAAFLQKDKREVYLQGDAFFDVAKDSKRPFFVYSGDLVVHVLGTSFKVSTNKTNGNVTVLVKTGKVAVSSRTDAAHPAMILMSDQKALFDGQKKGLVQLHADKMDRIPEEDLPAVNFNFEETPVTQIFQTLESAYGVPFHYDQKTFAHVIVTTHLADEPLEEKIKIICAAIGASYEIKDNGVFLEGAPCKK